MGKGIFTRQIPLQWQHYISKTAILNKCRLDNVGEIAALPKLMLKSMVIVNAVAGQCDLVETGRLVNFFRLFLLKQILSSCYCTVLTFHTLMISLHFVKVMKVKNVFMNNAYI